MVPKKSDVARHADALLVHAKALDGLSQAIRAHTASGAPPQFSQAQKINELAKIFSVVVPISSATSLSDFVGGGPGAIDAWFEEIDQWPAFQQRGLTVNVTEAHAATTFGALANAIV
jgi:hypothetical protein